MLISLGICEVVLRLAWRNPFQGESPDQIIRLGLHHPSRNLPIDRSAIDPAEPIVWLRTDERSYLLPSRRFEDPEATIAFLGGSTTECVAVREDLRFPALVSTLLEERGRRVNTLNAAKSGNTVHDSLNVLLNHVVNDLPDVVVLMHATNDIGVLGPFKSYQPRMGAPMDSKAVLRWVLQEASSTSYVAGILRNALTIGSLRPGDPEKPRERGYRRGSVPAADFEHRLRSFVGISRSFGIEPVLMTQPVLELRTPLTPDWIDPANQAVFNQAIRAVAEQEEVVLIDLDRHIRDEVDGWDQPMTVFYDGMHVTDLGSRIYAEYIAARLLESVL